MKNVFKYLFFVSVLCVAVACSDDERPTQFLEEIQAPSNLSLLTTITQDNSGLVTFAPNGEGATAFEIQFGDAGEIAVLLPGETTSRVYAEGVYNVVLTALGIDGDSTELQQELTVTFKQPENLSVTINPVAGNVFAIDVDATADFETYFEFYPGISPDEEPIPFMEGEPLRYTYAAVGNYDTRVVALSGGAATTTYTETVSIVNPLTLPINFEDSTLNYEFVDFGNVASSVVANPDASGINTSSTVGQTIKPNGAEVWGGTFLQLDDPIDFSSLNHFQVKVWAPQSGIVVKLKLENATDGAISTEIDVTNTVANAWETLVFDFSNANLTQEYHKVVLFFDFGNPGNGNTYYFDDISLTQSNSEVFETVETFEGTPPPAFVDFGGIAPTEVVPNPDPDGINGSNNVARFIKANGAQVWGGTFFELTDQVIRFGASKKMQLRTYSPKTGIVVKLKLENADASITHEVDVVNTVANSWETLTYDFIDAPEADYVRVVVFFDFGNPGDDTIYFFDTVEAGEGALVSTQPPLAVQNFEGTPPAFVSFGNIAETQVTTNPNPDGTNSTANVAELFKTAGSEVWAGTFFETNTPLDFTNYSKIKVLTHAPASGLVVKLKLENADASITHEVDVTNTVANAWETLVYDFQDAPVADYVRIVIFFDFGNPGTDASYYFDEIELIN